VRRLARGAARLPARQPRPAGKVDRLPQLKDSLIATVSHDLRTPLTSIKALASEIAADGDERARTIESEADRLNMLVADLLDLSRIQAGELKLDVQVNSAEDLVGSVLRDMAATLKDRKVEIRFEQPVDNLVGSFDFLQSLRVVSNLVENAHKYSAPDQPIEIAVRRDGDILVFAISDRGPGIPNAERHLIYQPFYRGGSAGGTAGTGLGLAIASRLAEMQGGVIRHMARVGGGTTFVYRLPAANPPD
jgi:two-component system sensor histidine kinase KdpD